MILLEESPGHDANMSRGNFRTNAGQKYSLSGNNPTPDNALELLRCIPKRPNYDIWIHCIAAIGNTFDEQTALRILLSHFKDEKQDETLYHLRHRLHSISYGTLIYLALQNGYKGEILYQGTQRFYPVPTIATAKAPIRFNDVDTRLLFRFKDKELEERAATMEYDGGLSRYEAEQRILLDFPNAEKERVYRIAVNPHVKNKTTDYEVLNSSFENCVMSIDEIADHIKRGDAICCCVLREDAEGNTHRNSESWEGAELVAIDIDDGLTIGECLHIAETRYAILLYTTPSHTEERNRFRLLFPLPYFETDKERYRQILLHYINIYKADSQAKDIARCFYGNTEAQIINFRTGGNLIRLPDDFVPQELRIEHLATSLNSSQECQDCHSSDSIEDGNLTTWEDTAAVIGSVEWCWYGWLPLGLLTFLVAESGQGKSMLALWIAGILSKGGTFPDGLPRNETGKILWIDTENAQAINIDRVKKLGLDMASFVNPLPDILGTLQLENSEHREYLRQRALRDDIKLIVLDSLSGGHRQSENSTDMIAVMGFLADLIQEAQKPCLVIHHLNKLQTESGKPPTLAHVRGSSSIVQFARVIWSIDAPDKTQPEIKRLSQIKNNLAPLFSKAIGFEIQENTLFFRDIPEIAPRQTKVEQAAKFLCEYLQDGERKQKDIDKEAKEKGISKETLNDAKKRIRVQSRKRRNPESGKDEWLWSLPPKEDSQE